MGLFDKFKEKREEEKKKKPEATKKPKIEKTSQTAAKHTPKVFSSAYRILIKPTVSEKASWLSEEGKYVFFVAKKAKKEEVKRAIFSVYGVKPTKVNFINIKGKRRRYGRSYGRTKDYKKAIVTLPKGAKIQIYEGV